MSKQPIPVIRAIFGNSNNIERELNELTYQFPYEMVYCWGEDNYDLMRKYSKNVHLVSGEKFDLVNSEMEHVLKLVASSLAYEHYGEHLLLDWDVGLDPNYVKERPDGTLDMKEFWKQVRQHKISMPLYAWWLDKSDYYQATKKPAKSPIVGGDAKIVEAVRKYGWRYKDMWVVPNACWIYTDGEINIGKELLDYVFKHDIKALVEEIGMKEWTGMTLEDYIVNHQPIPMFGKHGMYGHYSDEELDLQSYIKEFVNVKPMLKHI